jgi:outer membrane autotransporter protein
VTNASNAYTGGTNINQGTLSFSNGALGTTGTVAFTGISTLQYQPGNTQDLTTGGRLTLDAGVNGTIDTNGNNVTFGSPITTDGGTSGALTKTGLGTLSLAAANTYGGGTNIMQGTLNFVTNGLGTGLVTFTGNSTLQWATGNTQDVSTTNGVAIVAGVTGTFDTNGNNITLATSLITAAGAGVAKVGNGVLTLGGTNTYTGATTVTGGTLKAGTAKGFSANSAFTVNTPAIVDINGLAPTIGSLAGTGTVTNSNATAGLLITGNDNTSTTFSGLIQNGTGTTALTKIGTGTFTLNTANTYSGGTSLQNGTLVVANSNALGVGNVTVTGGALQAGGSNMNINVGGNYTQTSGGELDLRIGGTTTGTHDQLTVTGSAAVSGKLSINAVNGYAPKNGDVVPIVTAGGGVSGQFAPVTGSLANYPLVKLTVHYLSNEVDLDFSQGSFMAAATILHQTLTPNERAVATALDHVATNTSSANLLGYLDALPFNSLPAAYDRIAPAEYGAIYEIDRSATKLEAASIENRLDEVHAGAPAAGAVPTGANGPAGPEDYKGSKEVMPPPDKRLSVFANGSGEFVNVGDSYNAKGYNFDSGAATVGADYLFTDHFLAGVLLNYTGTEADLTNGGRIDANAFRGGVYATLFGDGAYVNAFAGGAYSSYNVDRQGLNSTVRGNTDGSDFTGLITTGYDVHAGGFTYGPVASFQYTYTGFNGFNETGSLAPLHIQSGSGQSILSNVGARAAYDWHIGSMVLVPEVRATWQHEYGDDTDAITADMLLGSPVFRVTSAPIGRDSLVLNAGFTLRITADISAYAFYDGELARTNYQANNVMVGFRTSF